MLCRDVKFYACFWLTDDDEMKSRKNVRKRHLRLDTFQFFESHHLTD